MERDGDANLATPQILLDMEVDPLFSGLHILTLAPGTVGAASVPYS